jgi:hypothetical protein
VDEWTNSAPIRDERPAKLSELDPEAQPTRGFNVRLNEYEIDLVRRVAKMQKRSRMSTIRLLLVPALEAALRGGGR